MRQFVSPQTLTYTSKTPKLARPDLSENGSPETATTTTATTAWSRSVNVEQQRRRTATCGSKSVCPVSRPVGKGQLSCSRQIVWTADYEHLSTGHTKVSNPGNTVNIHPVGSHSALHHPHPNTHKPSILISRFVVGYGLNKQWLKPIIFSSYCQKKDHKHRRYSDWCDKQE